MGDLRSFAVKQEKENFMHKITKALLSATASVALSAGVLGATAGPAAAYYNGPSVSPVYFLCENRGMGGECNSGTGPKSVPSVYLGGQVFNDAISSIQTNYRPIHTWNDRDYKGTYGYFAPNWRWEQLNSPYDNEISSYQIS
ncbi:hypothetical protein ACWCPM_11020 [Streptomyces sp. NPDC002309]